MRATATTWRDIRAAEDAAVLALAHQAMCERARELMPSLDQALAGRLRVAMLAGPGSDLQYLIREAHDAQPEHLHGRRVAP